MANLKNVIYLSNEDYETLVSTGTVTIDGETLTYDENNVYITPDKLASTTEDGLMSAADKSKLDNIESGAQVNVQSDWNQTDIGADDYIKNKPQVDTNFSLTSTNALQNKVISEKLEYIDYALTHIKYKLFGVTTLSEIDYKVDYATIYPIPETLSDDDGTHRVVYSDTQLKEVEGNSVAFNQLVNKSTLYANSTNISVDTNTGKVELDLSTFVKYANSFTLYNGSETIIDMVKGHKYLLKGFKTTSTPSGDNSWWVQVRNNTTNVSNRLYNENEIFTANNGGLSTIYLYVSNNYTANDKIVGYPQIFDLTLMGLDSITSVEEFNRIFPLTYYPYNAGEIRSTVIKVVKVNGYNLFDGELQQGYYDTATEPIIIRNDNNYICSKEKIRVVAGKTYTLETDDDIFALGLNAIYIGFADENGKHISWNNNSISKTITFTIPNNAYWCYFEYLKSSGISVPSLNKCAFHLTGTRTGYAPYKEPHIIEIPQTELLSAGSVHDTIKFVEGNIVNGEQRFNKVYVSRISSVDLGTLNWNNGISGKPSLFYVGSGVFPSSPKLPSSSNNKANILCDKFVNADATNVINLTNDKTIALGGNSVLYIYDSDYNDTTTFKNAMSGVMLNYEKAEPTETTLATDLTFEEVSAIIEQGGSIETVFEIVPPNLKTAFVVNKAIVS